MEPGRPSWRACPADLDEKDRPARDLHTCTKPLRGRQSEHCEERQLSADRKPHRRERAPVMAGYTEPADRLAVLGGGVPDIGLPAVARIARREVMHDPV